MDAPLMAPPVGMPDDPMHTDWRDTYNIICQLACLGIPTIAIAARLSTVLLVSERWRLDDYACCLAWAALMTFGSLIAVLTTIHGGGQHLWNVPASTAESFLYWNNIAQILYGPFIWVTKLAILLLLARLFATRRQSWIFVVIQLLIWTNAAFYLAITITKIAACIPRQRIWDSTVNGHCVDTVPVVVTTGVFNTVSDIVILILPIRCIWQLQMGIRQKIGVSAAFGVGLIALLASILRLQVSIVDGDDPDVTYYQLFILLWSEAEIAAGVVCCCLPTLPALFRHIHRKLQPPAREQQTRLSEMPDAEWLGRRRCLGSKYLGKGDAVLFDEEYLGLSEIPHHHTPTAVSRPPQVVTMIRGDASPQRFRPPSLQFTTSLYTASRASIDAGPLSAGIMRTVQIDQYDSSASTLKEAAAPAADGIMSVMSSDSFESPTSSPEHNDGPARHHSYSEHATAYRRSYD